MLATPAFASLKPRSKFHRSLQTCLVSAFCALLWLFQYANSCAFSDLRTLVGKNGECHNLFERAAALRRHFPAFSGLERILARVFQPDALAFQSPQNPL
jgi:hypothetical protein